MTIEGVIWFTDSSGSFGIVFGRDDHTSEPKAYIGHATGLNEESDIRWIKDNGAKINPSIVKQLSGFLNKET